MNKSTMLKIMMVLGLVAGTFMMVMPAQAKVAIGTADGWEFSTDGWINAFAVMEDSDEEVNGGVAGMAHVGLELMQGRDDSGIPAVPLDTSTNNKTFRIRTGLIPCLLAFNIKAPTTNGIDVAARVGFYPQIQDTNQSRLNDAVDFGSHIDLREAFLTADGGFGQILAGRALHLYQGKNVLNDMTLIFGTGNQGGSSGNTTFGYIGYGYVYTQFGSQIRYTSPDLGGVKIAFGILDPASIDGIESYDIVESPGYEAEISYAGEVASGVKMQAWVNGMSQDAERADTATTTKSVTASGFAAGVGVDVAGLHVVASGFSGSGIGSAFMMAVDAVDADDKERDVTGYMAQIAYTIPGPNTKIGIQYGVTDIDESTADKANRDAGISWVDKRTAYTLGVYHPITPNWQVIAEYTMAKCEWFDGADRESSTFGLGTAFMW